MKKLKNALLILTIGLMSFTIKPIEKNIMVKVNVTTPLVWKSDSVELGQIPQGTPKLIEFEFKNTGTAVIKITDVHGSCGCTATDYTREDIAPGNTGIIKATFSAANVGTFTKTVTVKTTAEDNAKTLTFSGTVVVKS
jgi:hypothetical protein